MREDLEREYVEYLRTRMPQLRRPAALLTGDFHGGDDIVQSTAADLYVYRAGGRTILGVARGRVGDGGGLVWRC